MVVKTIVSGGVADADGRLQSGDHILRIGDTDVTHMGSEQAAQVLRQCGMVVRYLEAFLSTSMHSRRFHFCVRVKYCGKVHRSDT